MKHYIASAMLVVLGGWIAYEGILDFQRADFVALCFAIGVSLGVFALAFTPQFLFERVSLASFADDDRPMPKVAMVLGGLGALALIAGALLTLWEFVR